VSSPASRRVWAVVPAAGRGLRFDPTNLNGPKQYAPLAGATVLEWSLAALLAEPRVEGIVIAVAADDGHWSEIADSLSASSKLKIRSAIGGGSRAESVLNGLEALATRAGADDWVMVHDAARPCLTAEDLGALIDAVQGTGSHQGGVAGDATAAVSVNGAVLSSPIVDTVRRERGGAIETVDREGLWRALTPQVFRLGQLRRALSEALRSGVTVTDEAQAMELLGFPARLVRGSAFNIKVTTPKDLGLAESILAGLAAAGAAVRKNSEKSLMRIGQGFDVHAFGDGDHVVMGGVTIPYAKGVVAHSDGDVVIHALCDAVLGALGLGDIGQHFPDTDPRYRGVDSRVFLREVTARMNEAGLELVNADITVLAEAPRIGKYRAAMAENLAADMGVAAQRVNIKATTTEKLGFIGRGEGLAASAAVLLDAKTAR
jgi:2-C-methyl-D-erythritol 4-phosphate cytidylyltransferase / 2-C-methyl-D-erythritol 2,4-cyclodiphosphate synthase